VISPLAGTLDTAARLARRVATLGRRWSAGSRRRCMAAMVGLAS
jgi:hypothetical protein